MQAWISGFDIKINREIFQWIKAYQNILPKD